MIDVHLITLPDTRRDWLEKCIDSLAGEPIHLHIVDGVRGHIGIGRRRGFQCGDSEFVSFVDPDDWVVPGAFRACFEALVKNESKAMAYTREALALESGFVYSDRSLEHYTRWLGTPSEPDTAHHITVFRRDVIAPFLPQLDQYRFMPELFLKQYAWLHGGFRFVDRIGYVWRKHPKNSHRVMASDEGRRERMLFNRWRDTYGTVMG